MQEAIKLTFNGKTLRGMEHVPEGQAGEKLPAVILFHGFTGQKLESHRIFLKICRTLEAQGIAGFRYDFYGSGESDGDFEEMTSSGEIAEASAILDAVLQDPRIDPKRVALLGMSMGGMVASVVAGDRPQDVARLVLLCPAGSMYPLIEAMAGPALADPTIRTVDVGGNLVGRGFAEDAKTLDVYGRAVNYKGDVLLVHGTNDPTVPFAVSQHYQANVYEGRATLHPIEGADHTYNKHEWEQEVIRTVADFLQKL